MAADLSAHPYPDYVACPYCGEPEVEVWCYELAATCHACGRQFDHALPKVCQGTCQTHLDDGATQRECMKK